MSQQNNASGGGGVSNRLNSGGANADKVIVEGFSWAKENSAPVVVEGLSSSSGGETDEVVVVEGFKGASESTAPVAVEGFGDVGAATGGPVAVEGFGDSGVMSSFATTQTDDLAQNDQGGGFGDVVTEESAASEFADQTDNNQGSSGFAQNSESDFASGDQENYGSYDDEEEEEEKEKEGEEGEEGESPRRLSGRLAFTSQLRLFGRQGVHQRSMSLLRSMIDNRPNG